MTTTLTTGFLGSGSSLSGTLRTSTKRSLLSGSGSTASHSDLAHKTTTSKWQQSEVLANANLGSVNTWIKDFETQLSSIFSSHQTSANTKKSGSTSTRPILQTLDSDRTSASDSNSGMGLGSIKPGDQLVTIGHDVFEVDPANLVLNKATVRPGAGLVTVDGYIISADSARDLFADGTEILTAPIRPDTTRSSRSSVLSLSSTGTPPIYGSASTTKFSSATLLDEPTTITSAPTLVTALDAAGPAASQSGIILAALLLKFAKDHQDVEKFIINPVVEQKFKDDTEQLHDDALKLFKEIGGIDPDNQDCSSGGLLGFLEKAACAVQSSSKLSKDLNIKGPDIDEIEGDVDDIADLGNDLQNPQKPEIKDEKKQSTQKATEASSTTSFDMGNIFLTMEAWPPMDSDDPDAASAQMMDLVGGVLQSLFVGQMSEPSGFQTSRTTKPSATGNPHAGNIPGNVDIPVGGNRSGGASSTSSVASANGGLVIPWGLGAARNSKGGSTSSNTVPSVTDKLETAVAKAQTTAPETKTQHKPNTRSPGRDSTETNLKQPQTSPSSSLSSPKSKPTSHITKTKSKSTTHTTSVRPATSTAPPAPNTGIAIWLQLYATTFGVTIGTWFAYTYTPSHPPSYGDPCAHKPVGDTSVPSGIDIDKVVQVFPTEMDLKAYGKTMAYTSYDDAAAGFLLDTKGAKGNEVAGCKLVVGGEEKECAGRTLRPVVMCEWWR
ncbi:hypothetical protein MMC21_003855 [Puttea exsequens]|nr:hypothetical protein [Puttea exsequens]